MEESNLVAENVGFNKEHDGNNTENSTYCETDAACEDKSEKEVLVEDDNSEVVNKPNDTETLITHEGETTETILEGDSQDIISEQNSSKSTEQLNDTSVHVIEVGESADCSFVDGEVSRDKCDTEFEVKVKDDEVDVVDEVEDKDKEGDSENVIPAKISSHDEESKPKKTDQQWDDGAEGDVSDNDDNRESNDDYTDAEDERYTDEEEEEEEYSGRRRKTHELSEGEISDQEDQVDAKRLSGDGEEEPKDDQKSDDAEDRRNPTYVPRKGTFFEHDLRSKGKDEEEVPEMSKSKKKSRADDKWKHDKFDIYKQAPKRTYEIVSIYGYDIRKDNRMPDRNESRRGERWEREGSEDGGSLMSGSPRDRQKRAPNNYRSNDLRRRSDRDYRKNNSNRGSYRTEIITTGGEVEGGSRREDHGERGDGHGRGKLDNRGSKENRPHAIKAKDEGLQETNRSNSRNQNHSQRKCSESEDLREVLNKNSRNRHYLQRRYQNEEEFGEVQDRNFKNRPFAQKKYTSQRQPREVEERRENNYAPRRDDWRGRYEEPRHRDHVQQRPPRLVKQYGEMIPRDLDFVNSNVSKGRAQAKPDESEQRSTASANQDEQKPSSSVNAGGDATTPTTMAATSSTTKLSTQPSGGSEARKGWVGGEFTPGWKTQQQRNVQGNEEDDANARGKSKRYSSLRQQQNAPQYRDIDYCQQYPQYSGNAGGRAAAYEASHHTMIPHQGLPHATYMPHSTFVTNSYGSYYSTLPGNVYPSPPVYQHSQPALYTTTSYVNHVPQGPEGPVFYGPQGIAQGQYFEAASSSAHQIRANSAIPIINPQDYGSQSQIVQTELRSE